MRRGRAHWLAVLSVVVGLSAPATAQDVNVRAVLDTEDVELGEPIGFRLVVEGAERAEGPPVEAFGPDFDVRDQGGRRSSSFSFRVNGRDVVQNESEYVLYYELTPRRAGDLVIPSLPVTVEEKEFSSAARKLHVMGLRPSDRAYMELVFQPQRVYVEQPVDFVLRIGMQRTQLDGEWFTGAPWVRPPRLRVPWFLELDGFLTSDPDRFARSVMAPGGATGFSINAYADRRGLFLFQFDHDSEIRGSRAVYVYKVRKTFVPLETGSHEIPLSTLSGDLAVTREFVKSRDQYAVREREALFISHEPVTLTVLPIPEAGRPSTYTHAVGRFAVAAEASPKRVRVGDPITVTLTVRGQGILERVKAPRLAAQADLVEAFQVSNSEKTLSQEGERKFTYVVRPRSADLEAIPALEFASFDPRSEEFVIARTDPISIDVEEATAVLLSEVVVAPGSASSGTSPGEEITGGLLGNYAAEDTLADETFAPGRSPLVWLLLVFPPLALVVSVIAARRRDAHERDPAERRARTALARAIETIAEARGAFDAGDEHAAAGRLHASLAGFVADRARCPAAGITAADVEGIFQRSGVAGAVGEGVLAAMRDAEASRFGGASGDLSAQIDAATGWLRALQQERLS